MRLATAADEILPMKDARVQALPAYLIVILLARVVTRLGTLPEVNAGVIERLFSADLAYLQDMYNRINAPETVSYTHLDVYKRQGTYCQPVCKPTKNSPRGARG